MWDFFFLVKEISQCVCKGVLFSRQLRRREWTIGGKNTLDWGKLLLISEFYGLIVMLMRLIGNITMSRLVYRWEITGCDGWQDDSNG